MFRVFRVFRSDETRVDVDGDVLGWGVQFPSGLCVVDWNRMIFDVDDRLEHPHLSQYGSPADVEQGTGGEVALEDVLGRDDLTREQRREIAETIDDATVGLEVDVDVQVSIDAE